MLDTRAYRAALNDLDAGQIEIRQQLQPVGKALVPPATEDAEEPTDLALPTVCVTALAASAKRKSD